MQEPGQSDPFAAARHSMVVHQLRNRGIYDVRVLRAMDMVPRHEFVPAHLQRDAYDDNPLPIGEGQTVSQPYIVAYMLEVLEIAAGNRVLEIGTGTGYQAALLGHLAREVYTMERVPALFEAAQANVERFGYSNVTVINGDGTRGLPEHAPYDRIIVAAAAPDIPAPLFEQLAEGGRMVIPVGPPDIQELLLVRKQDGSAVTQKLEGCRFVPLVGETGFPPQ
jgi:protein-L-isoaspartate(D-aspartate) O-methyltransferase